MKIIRNEKLIKRNAKISQYVLYAALITLVLGIYFTLTKSDPEEIGLAYLFLIPSYILVQISITMGNVWSRSPRPDEVVANSLKGLDNQYSLYIYSTAIPHLLIGPAGIWAIKAYHQSGKIYLHEKKKVLKQKGGGNFFTKFFANESIGNVAKESVVTSEKLEKYFNKHDISDHPTINVANVFISDDIAIDVDSAEYPEVLLTADKLKDFIRKTAKQVNVEAAVIDEIVEKLPKES